LTGGNDIALNGPGTTNGNVAVSSGTLSLNGSAGPEVHGNVYLAGGAGISIGNPPQVTGTVFTNQNLSQPNTDARQASQTFAGLTPNVTVAGGQVNSTTTILAIAGLNVVDVSNIHLGNGQTLTLNGPAGSEFIINDSGNLTLNSGQILLAGGVTNTDVVINDTATGNAISASGGGNASVVNGIILAPNSGIAFSPGLVNGEVIAGGSTIHFVSGAGVNQPSIPTVPEPSTYLLMASGLAALVWLGRKRARLLS
jgi:hypothetical protein